MLKFEAGLHPECCRPPCSSLQPTSSFLYNNFQPSNFKLAYTLNCVGILEVFCRPIYNLKLEELGLHKNGFYANLYFFVSQFATLKLEAGLHKNGVGTLKNIFIVKKV